MDICCHHCKAKRPNLHLFTEGAGEEGTFEVVRCLLCGWQTSRLKPWKRRPRPSQGTLAADELEEKFLNFVSDAQFGLNGYGSEESAQRTDNLRQELSSHPPVRGAASDIGHRGTALTMSS